MLKQTDLIKANGHQLSVLDKISKCEVGILLSMGFSNKHIMRELRVSEAQIARVVKENPGLRRKMYRDGLSHVAQFVTQKARSRSSQIIYRPLKLDQPVTIDLIVPPKERKLITDKK